MKLRDEDLTGDGQIIVGLLEGTFLSLSIWGPYAARVTEVSFGF